LTTPTNQPKKLVFNDALLKAFINGTLEPKVEQKVAEYLESRPELLAKVTSTSGDGFLNRMREAKLRSVAPANHSVAFTQSEHVKADVAPAAWVSKTSEVPEALANYSGYQIAKELGRGGMGVVYLAKNVQMDRLEVLKVLSQRLLDHDGAKERFLREVRAVSKLNHPNIVTSYSILPIDKLMVFAMEYVHGMDLHKFIQKHRPIQVGIACSLVRQLALGLQHAHEKGLVHRDIKPSNAIVYKSDGQLQTKILDFGLAKATSEKKSDGLTQDGTMLGTPEYMSPEQTLNAAKADIRADIYSLGCTLYHILSGKPPFTGTHGEILMAHAQREAPTINLQRADVSPELGAVIARMMAKEMTKRYQTPSEVSAALEKFIGKGSTSKNHSNAAEPAPNTVTDLAASERDTSVEEPKPELSLDYVAESRMVKEPLQSLAEMLNRPRPTQLASRKARKQPKSKRSVLIGSTVAIASLFFMGTLWLNGIFHFKTPEGTIVIEKMPEDAEVFVDGKKFEVKWNKGKDVAEVSVVPGKRDVRVESKGVTVLGETVEISSNLTKSIRVIAKQDANQEGKKEKSRDALISESAKWWIDKETQQLVQDAGGWANWIFFGDEQWTDYIFTFEACKMDGPGQHGSFSALFRAIDNQTNHAWEFGSFGDAQWTHVIYKSFGQRLNPGNSIIRKISGIEPGHWYGMEVRAIGDKIMCLADGAKIFEYSSNELSRGKVGLRSGGPFPVRFRNLKVTTPEGELLWEGFPGLETNR